MLTDGSLRLRAGVVVGKILPTPAPTPTPGKTVDSDPLQLQSRLRLRRPDFDCIQTGDTALQYPFALTADAADRGYRRFP